MDCLHVSGISAGTTAAAPPAHRNAIHRHGSLAGKSSHYWLCALLLSAAAATALAAPNAFSSDPASADPEMQSLATNAAEAATLVSPGTQLEPETYLQQLENHRQNLSSLQAQFGSYDQRLLEPMSAMSQFYIASGDFSEAIPVLDRQLEIQRVVNGLYSGSQVPTLEALLKLKAVHRDWGEVANKITYLSWLYSRTTDLSPEEQLAGLKRLRDWQLQLIAHDDRTNEARHIFTLQSLEHQALEIALSRYGEREPERLDYIYDAAQAELLLGLSIIAHTTTSQEIIHASQGITTSPPQPGQSIQTQADLERAYGALVTTVVERAFRQYMQRHFKQLSLFREAYAETGNTEAEAMALLYMGDSILIRQQYEARPGLSVRTMRGTSNTGSAARYYQQAYELFREAGISEETLDAHLGCPVLLPSARFLPRIADLPICPSEEIQTVRLTSSNIPGIRIESEELLDPDSFAASPSVVVKFDVAVNGQARRAETLQASPDSNGSRGRARDALEQLQFRPALHQGRPRPTEMVQLQIHLPPHS